MQCCGIFSPCFSTQTYLLFSFLSSFFLVAYIHSTRSRMTAPRWPPHFSLPGSCCSVYSLYVYVFNSLAVLGALYSCNGLKFSTGFHSAAAASNDLVSPYLTKRGTMQVCSLFCCFANRSPGQCICF